MGRQLRIGFVAYRGNMHCGGQGVYLWFLARELAKLGHLVDVFVGPPYPDPMPFAARVRYIDNQELWAKWFTQDYAGMLPASRPLAALEPLNLYELAASWLGFLPEPFAFSLRAFGSIRARLRAGERWDLIHDVQCLGYGLLGLRAMGIPVVTTVHHPLTVDRRASFVRDTNLVEALGTMQFYPIGMQSFVARRMDRVLTSSECSASQIEKDFGVPRHKIANVCNGLDTDLYSPDPGVVKDENKVLCVGRASDPNKGIRTLIEALAHTAEPIHLTLVDNNHPNNEVFKWARTAGVIDRIEVTGRLPQDELIAHYRSAALVAVPSRYEGFGLPAVEAMACGTPVVACEAGALCEVMQQAGGGITVPIDDPSALGAGIQELMGQPDRRHAFAETGRRKVGDIFSWPRIARRTAEVYGEVLSERRGRPDTRITSARTGATRAHASRP